MHITGHSRRSRAFSFRHYLLIPLLLVQAAFIPLCKAMADPDEIWLLVDTSRLKLTVMRGDAPLREYENIAIGSNGQPADTRHRHAIEQHHALRRLPHPMGVLGGLQEVVEAALEEADLG